MPRFSTFCREKNDDVSSPRKNIRNIKLQSLSQISKHESIALVIRWFTQKKAIWRCGDPRKSIQRGMAVAQLRENSGSNEEPLVREILSLGEKSLSGADHLKLQSTLTDSTKNIQFVLSNKDAYEEVALLKIDANKSIFFPQRWGACVTR